jgi:hypothetical protein
VLALDVLIRLSSYLSAIVLLVIAGSSACAQGPADSSQTATYVFAGVGGFIPIRESYRINYSTSLGGLPIEVMGGVLMPVSEATSVPLTVRYERREASFVSSTSISVLSFEPGVRYYLERQRHGDIRIFGGLSGLIAQATVQGTYDATSDGSSPEPATTSKSYLNFGLGIDIGATYPIASQSWLDAVIHIANYLGSPISTGGIGNIGGVSLGAAYRIGF